MEYVKDDGTLEKIAGELIGKVPELAPLAEYGVYISYQKGLGSKKSGGRTVYADCRRVPDWLCEFVPIDFVITFYEPADRLTDEGLRVLMHHELLHIEVDDAGFKIRAHDLQDFRAITDVYGVDWVASFRDQMRMEDM